MVTRIVTWASVLVVLLLVLWGRSAGPGLPLDFIVLAGAVLLILTLFFLKRQIEIHQDAAKQLAPARRTTRAR